MKSKNKRGRPRTNRKPVLVRFDKETLSLIDIWKKRYNSSSRPQAIREILSSPLLWRFYMEKSHDLDR